MNYDKNYLFKITYLFSNPIFIYIECFEFSINEKMIYSVKTLKDWPNFDEIYEIVYWMYRVIFWNNIIYVT